MQKFFCDKCGEECTSKAASARKFEKLAKILDGETPLGLEVTPTYGGAIGTGGHICDECIPELLLLAAKTFKDSGAVAKQELIHADAKNHIAMKRILERQLDMANKRERSAELQLTEAAKCIADAEAQKIQDAERITALSAELTALQNKFNTMARIKAAAEKQLEEDIKNDPEYVQSVERRERLRISK